MTVSEQELASTRRAIQVELEHVLQCPEFAGSERSGHLLRYLVEYALGGNQTPLKERTIGIEVFGRDASYDTGKDAIVRVSANSVRKRLLSYHTREAASRSSRLVEIHLAPGSYTPEFVWPQPAAEPAPELPAPPPPPAARRPWLATSIILLLLIACGWLGWSNLELRRRTAPFPGMELLPWSKFAPQSTVRVVITDGNFAMYQFYTKRDITLEEYSNERFTFDFNERYPQAVPFLRNQYTSIVSTTAAVRISAMLQTTGRSTLVMTARKMQTENFKGDQPAVVLGSWISNPWMALFRDNVNFFVEVDPKKHLQYMVNRHPRDGEQATYLPVPRTDSASTAYAHLSMLPNLTGKGTVLLLAGTNGEGTGAASELLTDPARLRQELLKAGIDPAGNVQKFELLLKVECLGSESRRYEVIASRVTR